MRLTALYGGLFLASGAGLLAITYALVAGERTNAAFQIAGAVRGNFKLVPVRARVIAVPPGLPAQAAKALRQVLVHAAGGQVTLKGPPPPGGSPTFLAFQATLPTPDELHRLLVWCGIALAIMAVVSIGLGWLVAGRVLSPLRVMTSNARHISAENLHERLGLKGPPDELKDLGDTIDDLLARLETAFEAQKRFVANASHELRTPLTMMRTSVDVAVGKARPSPEVKVLASKVGEGLDEADRLLEGLLVLARAQRGTMGDVAAVSLPDLVSVALAADQGEIALRHLAVENQMVPATVMGNETLLALMVANVVDNAVLHNVEGGQVHISNDSDGVSARLVIENGGAVLDENEVQLLGEPFHKIGAERVANGHGVGLGLSIVSAITTAHGGALQLRARPEGGLRVVIELPVAVLV